jgi:hypothetical protein
MAITEKLNLNTKNHQSPSNKYTFEEILASPNLAHYHDLVRYLQKTPKREIFPKKFELRMQDIATDNVYILFKENPNTSLNNVVSVIMDKLPKDLKPQMLLKLVQITIEKWEELTAEKAAQEQCELEHA